MCSELHTDLKFIGGLVYIYRYKSIDTGSKWMTELFLAKLLTYQCWTIHDCTLQGRHENIDWSKNLMEDKTITQLCASIIINHIASKFGSLAVQQRYWVLI